MTTRAFQMFPAALNLSTPLIIFWCFLISFWFDSYLDFSLKYLRPSIHVSRRSYLSKC